MIYAEGAPDFPPNRLWRLIEYERVTMLGISPTLTRALIPKGDPQHDRGVSQRSKQRKGCRCEGF